LAVIVVKGEFVIPCLLRQAQLQHNLATVQAQGAYVLGEDGRAVV
jgi:hypothetical protein